MRSIQPGSLVQLPEHIYKILDDRFPTLRNIVFIYLKLVFIVFFEITSIDKVF